MNKFQLKMSRRHLTNLTVRALSSGSAALPVPLRQSIAVSFQSEVDAFSLSNPELIAQAIPSLQERAQPELLEEEGWGAWQPDMLRESYDFPAPAELLFSAGTPAGDQLSFSLTTYWDLYGDDAFDAYRALETWFCCIGNGMSWDSSGHLVDGFTPESRILAIADAARERAQLDAKGQTPLRSQELHELLWGQSLLIAPPVKLYPVSEGYSKIFDVPENVEDSFLLAVVSLIRYLLRRPVWENFAYTPDALVAGNDPEARVKVWETDQWRHVALADGAEYRAKIKEAYKRLILGSWGPRLARLGIQEENFYPLDYRLPPRSKKFKQLRAAL
jgi:hypothetical protein